jgi:hypothetical protein
MVQEPEHTTEKQRTPEEEEVLPVLHKELVVRSWLRPSHLQDCSTSLNIFN